MWFVNLATEHQPAPQQIKHHGLQTHKPGGRLQSNIKVKNLYELDLLIQISF